MRKSRFPVDGDKIMYLREERGWTATRLAQKVGISLAFMRRIELKERQPSPAVRKRIADVLEVSLHAIVNDDDQAANAA